MTSERAFFNEIGAKRRSAMALPLALIVLLVAGVMVSVSLYFIQNMATVSRMKTEDEILLNAALDGVERGKTWIFSEVDSGRMPTYTTQAGSGDLGAVTAPDFSELFVAEPLSYDVEGAAVVVRIYDLAYAFTDTLSFEPGIPPRIYTVQEGSSLRSGQSFASSNTAEGDTGAGTPGSSKLGAFLIRSEATYEKLTKSVEQAILVAP